MIRGWYEGVALIDTSAAIALHDPADPFHRDAVRLYATNSDLTWGALDVTAHELFTRVRYVSSVRAGLEHYGFLRDTQGVRLYKFQPADEADACGILSRYSDHAISFHDALCAAAMKRLGILKVFTFDRDFAVLGFVVLPGRTA